MPTRFKISDQGVNLPPASRLDLSSFEPRPDFGQMVVVMFRYKIEMVDKTERLLQARMQEGLGKDGVIERVELFHKRRASGSKLA
jgi:hypothetical protein